MHLSLREFYYFWLSTKLKEPQKQEKDKDKLGVQLFSSQEDKSSWRKNILVGAWWYWVIG